MTTVRGWLRAFTRNAETLRSVFTTLLAQLDPLQGPIRPTGIGLADAVEAIAAAVAAPTTAAGSRCQAVTLGMGRCR